MPGLDPNRRRVYGYMGVAYAVIGGALACLTGLSPDLLYLAAALPWVLALRPRFGWPGAVAAVFVTALLAPVLTGALWAPIPVSLPVGNYVAATVIALGGLYVVRRRLHLFVAPGRERVKDAGIALAGGLVWAVAVAAGYLRSGGTGLSWAMQGDFALNTSWVRRYIAQTGIDTFPTTNARPLEHTTVAAFTGLDHDLLPAGQQLMAETHATAHVWVLATAAVGFFAAVLALRACRAAGGWAGAAAPLVALVTSLAPLATTMLGDALSLGHLNSFLAAAVVLALAVAVSAPAVRPLDRVWVAALGGTVLMLLWTPVALVAAALGAHALVDAVREHRAGRRLRLTSAPAVAAIVAIALGVTLAAVFVAPEFVRVGDGPGGVAQRVSLDGFIIRRAPQWQFVVLGMVGAAGLVARYRAGRLATTSALTAASLAAAVAALVANQAEPWWPWSYYPTKMLVIATLVCVPLAAAWVVPLVAQVARPPRRELAAAAVAVGLTVGAGGHLTGFAPATTDPARSPVAHVLEPYWYGSAAEFEQRVYEAANDDQYVLYWRFGSADRLLNHVIGTATLHPQRGEEFEPAWTRARTSRQWRDVKDLCAAAEQAPLPTVVITRDAGLDAEVQAACPELGVEVRLEAGAG